MNVEGLSNGSPHRTPRHAKIADTARKLRRPAQDARTRRNGRVFGERIIRRDHGKSQSRIPYSLILYCSARRLIPNSFAALSR